MAKGPWKRVDSELAVATENDFVRRALPLARTVWPGLVETPHRKEWDAAGIDLVQWVDSGAFPTVVQAKGFHVREIGRDQAAQVERSVDAFLKSGIKCSLYVLLHNRDGRFIDFNEAASSSLERLTAAGAAEQVWLLDRQQFLIFARETIDQQIEEAMRAAALRRQKRFADLFTVKTGHVEEVPYHLGSLQVRKYEAIESSLNETTQTSSVSSLLLAQQGLTWTVVEGVFGSGKTTTVLHAAESRERVVVLTSCNELPDVPALTFNEVFRQALQESELWEERDAEEHMILEELTADAAIRRLSGASATNKYLLIVDGLDEHRAFNSLSGLQQLMNRLIDVECPVVLTTRTEHWEALAGTFNTAFSELSWKFKNQMLVPRVRLAAWTAVESAALVRSAVSASPDEVKSLAALAADIDQGRAEQLYGDLIYNPLMLRFIMEDVAAQTIGGRTRAALIERWARRKLLRDVAKHPGVAAAIDVEKVVDELFNATVNVALRMTDEQAATLRLTETIEADVAKTIIGGSTELSFTDVLVNSFLLVRRRGKASRIAFVLRLLQEFFLAVAWHRVRRDPGPLPNAVRRLYDEYAAAQA